MTTKTARQRGRPRQFDPDEAVAKAQTLFHARGYDAVTVADVTSVLGITPPSFYAAFGSKAGLYARVLDRWAHTGAIPLADLLRPDRDVAQALTDVLEDAARRYAAQVTGRGCLVLEGTRCQDRDAREAACGFSRAAEGVIHDYIAARHPAMARQVTDFMVVTMSGLSAASRSGHGVEQLLASARLAGSALALAIPAGLACN